MSKVIDLNLLDDETLTFKIGGKSIEIPCSPKTNTVIQMMKLESKLDQLESEEEQFALLTEMVCLIPFSG